MPQWMEWFTAGLAAFCMILGAVFLLIAAIGVLRFRDTIARAHALGVGATLGILGVMLGVILSLHTLGPEAKSLLTVVFILLTSPVGSHLLARSAYRAGQTPTLEEDEWRADRHRTVEPKSSPPSPQTPNPKS